MLDLDATGTVTAFREKPRLDGWINIGFMILQPHALEVFTDDCVLEEGPLAHLAREGRLAGYRHPGFWQPMDTFRESKMLNDLWDTGAAPWRLW